MLDRNGLLWLLSASTFSFMWCQERSSLSLKLSIWVYYFQITSFTFENIKLLAISCCPIADDNSFATGSPLLLLDLAMTIWLLRAICFVLHCDFVFFFNFLIYRMAFSKFWNVNGDGIIISKIGRLIPSLNEYVIPHS